MSANKKTDKPNYKPLVIFMWLIYFVGFFTVVSIFYRIASGKMGYMPTFEELENPKSDLASEIYATDGALLGKFYKENRTPVRFGDLSPNLVEALQATEDARFYEHSGIDPRGLLRVLVRTVILRQGAGGGSTITQQLAKNLYKRDTTRYTSKLQKAWAMGKIKFKEWVTAVKLEKNYTKKEIMAMYLNTVPFGHNSFGIKAAAKTYFDTTPDSLKVEEAAVLVGMLKGPSMYNPITKYPPKRRRVHNRRNTVFEQMVKYGFMTREVKDSISVDSIKLRVNKSSHLRGLAPYFREHLRTQMTAKEPIREKFKNVNSWKKDSTEWADNPLYGWCIKNRKPDGSVYNLYKDGLRIYTSIDSRMQRYAEEATREHMTALQKLFMKRKYKSKGWRKRGPFSSDLKPDEVENILQLSKRRSDRYRTMTAHGISKKKIEKSFNTPTEMRIFTWEGEKDTIMTPMDSIRHYKYYLNAGFMSIEPATGLVRAYIGGVNYTHFKYDHAVRARRQVGSTFKPFIYTLAMQGGYSPCHKIPNIDYTFVLPEGQEPPTYTPSFSTNKYIKKYDGKMITLKFGLAHSMNQISAWVLKQYTPEAAIKIARAMGVRSHLDPVPSLCTGAAEVTLSEMVSAYTTFANRGVHVDPVFVSRIEDKHGNVLASFMPKKKVAISEATAYKMVSMMRGVVDFGTSQRIRYKYKLTNPVAGKTGTTNDNSDGWFIGLTPELVSGAWVGGEERSIRFASTLYGQGANMALPIWALYMKKVYADKNLSYSQGNFSVPRGIDKNSLDCKAYEQEQRKNNDNDYDSYSSSEDEY